MKPSHSLVQRTVVLLLVFVLGFSFCGVGVGVARVDMHMESGNIDGDPDDGLDSTGGGSGGGEYLLPVEETVNSRLFRMPVFFISMDQYGLLFVDGVRFINVFNPNIYFSEQGEDRK